MLSQVLFVVNLPESKSIKLNPSNLHPILLPLSKYTFKHLIAAGYL